MQQHIVKPAKVDTKENDESILSEQITTETSLTDDLVRNSGVPLETAIKQVIKFSNCDNLAGGLIKSPGFRRPPLVARRSLPTACVPQSECHLRK